jgi:F-type H+-transporting ATPase subunit epsilon
MTPLKQVYKGEAVSIIGEATDGMFGVLLDHAPMLSTLKFSMLTVRESGGKEAVFVTSDGFFEITANKATVLIDTAEPAEAIDAARAEAAKQRAEERLRNRTDDLDLARAEAALQRAIIRLKAAKAH